MLSVFPPKFYEKERMEEKNAYGLVLLIENPFFAEGFFGTWLFINDSFTQVIAIMYNSVFIISF